MPYCTIVLHIGLVFRRGYSIGTPLFDDVGAEARICEKRDAIFKLAHHIRERAHPGKVRVALLFISAEYLRTHQMLWLFGGLWCLKLSLWIAL